jgi:hypothetical protein
MVRLGLFVVFLIAAAAAAANAAETKPPPVIPPDQIYTTLSVVTGSDERNRPLGFRLCFEDVLVKASGDATVLADRRVPALAAKAGGYIDTFSYFDRLFGRPLHDEQGSYDRPHYLTCHFNPGKIDNVLASLGRKTWKGARPKLAMLLTVHGRKTSGVLAADGDFDPDMREALGNAAQRYGMVVVLPATEMLRANGITVDAGTKTLRAKALPIAKVAGGDVPLIGDLTFSDKAGGWIARWHIDVQGRDVAWSASGINYDEAFRVAVRGAMRALSGNGRP